MQDFSKLIIISSHVPIFFAAGYAAIIYQQLRNGLKVFSWFLFAAGLLQLVSLLLWLYGINNMPVLHVYVLVSFILISRFYSTLLEGLINTKIIAYTSIIFASISVLNSIFLQPIFTFNSYALTLESLLIVILSLSTSFIFLDKSIMDRYSKKLPSLNWINAGILIYYSSSLLIFYFGDLITHNYSVMINRYTWIAHSFLSVVMYLCFILGLWKRPMK